MKKKYLNSLIILLSLLAFFGCGQETAQKGDSNAISEVTIINIPTEIPAHKDAPKSDTYKVYVYPSDNMTHDYPPAAKGLKKISDATLQGNGKYTVTIQMMTPDVWQGYPGGVDPNTETAPWKGTAKFFTVVLAPQDTMDHKYDSIWAKGGYTFDKTKSTIDWDKLTMNFRSTAFDAGLGLGERTKEFYYDIVDADPDINSAKEWYYGPDGEGNWRKP